MVDSFDLFRRLTNGTKINRSLAGDLAVFRPRATAGQLPDKTAIVSALDFFGDEEEAIVGQCKVQKVEERIGGGGGHKRSQSDSTDGGQRRPKKMKKSRMRGIRGQLHYSDSEDDGGRGGEQQHGQHEADEEEVEDERRDCGRIQLVSGHQLVFTDGDMDTSKQLDMKKRRRKQKKVNKKKRLNAVTMAALKHQEEANAFRNQHRIYVKGSDVPDAMGSFDEIAKNFKLPSYLMRNIAAAGYSDPTPVQMQAIPLMLSDREVLACAPTGSGKTAAFIIPIITHLKVPKKSGFRAIVLSPTRELAQQTYLEFTRLSAGSGLKVHVLTKATASANNFGPQSSQRFDVLVTTPNRLVNMLSQEPPAIDLHSVEWLVLDEADKLFEDGDQCFRDQVSLIYSSCDNPNIKHALFGATLASGVEEFSAIHFDSPVRITIGLENSATDTIKQELLFVGQESGKLIAMRDLIRKGLTPPVLVFVQSVGRAKELFHELIYDGMNVDVIHSERTQAQRDNVVKSFRAGKVWILICTDLMGRGIDFKGVNLVVNYDFPSSAISYIHRIGRTGRAGRDGHAITFFTEEDTVNLKSIANVMRSSGCDVPDWMLKLKKPTKNVRKWLSCKPVKRDVIKTVSKYDLHRAKKKRAMILSSKRKHQTAAT